jgi:hypothetical protein
MYVVEWSCLYAFAINAALQHGLYTYIHTRVHYSLAQILSKFRSIDLTRVARWFLFKPKNPNLYKFWSALDCKMLIYFMAICNISQTFEILFDQLVHFVFIWDIFSGFGIMHQEKSGNPGFDYR